MPDNYTSTFGITPYPPTEDRAKRRQFYDDYLQQKVARPDLSMREDETVDDYLQRMVVDPLTQAGAPKTGAAMATVPSALAAPWEPGIKAQEAIDEFLTSNVVEPSAKLGFPNVGAALATVPSTISDFIIPQSGMDLAGVITPMPKVAKALKSEEKAFPELRKAMKAEKKMENAGEYSLVIDALRKDDPDLGAIKVSSDLNVTPGMAKKNFRGSQAKNELDMRQNMMLQPAIERPSSEEVSGVRGGLKPYRWGIDDIVGEVLKLNRDIPGFKELEFKRNLLLNGRDPDQITVYDRERLALTKIEKQIAEIMKANQKQLKLPFGVDEKRIDVIPRSVLEEKRIEKQASGAKDWTKIDPKKLYELDGNILSGQDLKDELLQMSTGDFHMAKWKEVSDKTKGTSPSPNLKQIESPKPQTIEPPKSPKGDPEASLGFQKIRDSLNVAPARTDLRGRDATGKVGSYSYTPYEQYTPEFEDVVKRNYVEKDLDPVEQVVSKVLADPKNMNLSPEQKQALADFVRQRYASNEGMTLEAALAEKLNLEKSDGLRSYQGDRINDFEMLKKMHGTEDSEKFMKSYADLDKAFGPTQAIMSERHPSVGRMFDILDEVQPWSRRDTPRESAQELQRRMYSGRPSAEAEAKKYGGFDKIKEAVKPAKKEPKGGVNYTQGKYHVKDWAGNEMPQFGTYDDFGDAHDAITEILRKQGLDDDSIDQVLEDLVIEEKRRK